MVAGNPPVADIQEVQSTPVRLTIVLYDKLDTQMGLADWISNSSTVFRENGIKAGVRYFLKGGYGGVWRRAGQYVNRGTPIYEKDWDVLIVLDACRADLFAEVADEYEYIESVDSTLSVGSRSNEWMQKNFTTEYADQVAETALITGNPFSEEVVDQSKFELVDEVWKYAWDDKLGTIQPDPITDRAIDVSRNQNREKMILHYMQPHFPFVPCSNMHSGFSLDDFADPSAEDIWTQLERGKYTREKVWNAYRANLEYILDELKLLLDNLDYENVIITSDHGNALGEFGFYGHPESIHLNCLREVPWSRVSSNDKLEYKPDHTDSIVGKEVPTALKDLGYV